MRVPKYRRNGDGRAFVQYRNKRTYLGTHGTPESERRYRAFVAALFRDPVPVADVSLVTVAQVVEQYLRHAEIYYSTDGRPSQEFTNVKNSVVDFLTLFNSELVSGLGPKHLLQLQKELVKAGYARTSINSRVGRVKRFLRWAAANELIPRGVIDGMWAVDGLRAGRTEARETDPVTAISMDHVSATLAHTTPTVAAMIQVQYLCGMRPAEVCQMRACDIDMTGKIWMYRPAQHKNAWRKQVLIKAIPSLAQQLLKPFLTSDLTAYLFNPRDSVRFWAQSRPRKTKVWPYEQKQRKAAAAKSAQLPTRYTTSSYGKAIRHAVARANKAGVDIPFWSPNQLRHAIATDVSRRLGLQAASRWLGHAKVDTTGLYVEVQTAELAEIAGRLREAAH